MPTFQKFARIQITLMITKEQYWLGNYNSLKQNTLIFTNSFYKMDLSAEVVEAIAANLTILKSPTVFRQYGRMWNWEGTGDTWGS